MTLFHYDPQKLNRLHALWKEKPWTRPRPIGLAPSMGYGDRIGLATPGHLAAHRDAGLIGKVVPLFAQQSAREMERTGRTPVDVMLDAVATIGDSDFRHIHASDADHMKSEEHVRACLEAGFTWFTADPSDLVRDDADDIPKSDLDEAFSELVDKNPGRFDHFLKEYVGSHPIQSLGTAVPADEEAVERVALKYGPALYRAKEIDGWVRAGWKEDEPYDFEVSVDETSAPTSPLAHLVIARELKRLGVRVTALAPRFVGEFQKAIDYIGSIEEFRDSLRVHVALAKQEGPYKISVHSGSDKFSIYPVLAEECGDLLHLKTAGTSYLEALRVAARKDPQLFRKIAEFSAPVFEKQRATYHLKATLEGFPTPGEVSDPELENRFLASPQSDDARQALHVCFGAVLSDRGPEGLGQSLVQLLRRESGEYAKVLREHFLKHLVAFRA